MTAAPQSNTPPTGAGCQDASQIHPGHVGVELAIAGRGDSASDGSDYTPSSFDRLPPELTGRDRWILWRDAKVPYQALQPRKRASCTKPGTWASFDAARAAYVPGRDHGIGFVLGDGIAGVDIDHDVSEAARFLLETIGCAYIETSPSGNGLHGFALSNAKLPRCKGLLGDLHVEVYNRDRYFTVTGNALAQGPLVETDRVLRLAMALEREAEMRRFSESSASRFSESYESSESSESLEDHVRGGALVLSGRFLPRKNGERNAKLFEWCRHVKTHDPEATVQGQIEYAHRWYNAAKATIGTKDVAVTIDDFLRGWAKAIPERFDMKQLAKDAAAVPVPPLIAEALGQHALTFGLCVCLQRTTGDQPFFLPTRKLEPFLGTSQPTAAAALRILRTLGVLILAEEHTRTKAPRYYVAPEYVDRNG